MGIFRPRSLKVYDVADDASHSDRDVRLQDVARRRVESDEAIIQMHPTVRINQIWVLGKDKECGKCKPLHMQTVPVGSLFTHPEDGQLLKSPPCHPGCTCRLVTMSPLSKYTPNFD